MDDNEQEYLLTKERQKSLKEVCRNIKAIIFPSPSSEPYILFVIVKTSDPYLWRPVHIRQIQWLEEVYQFTSMRYP
jgi:hypothetical protein